MESSTTLSRPRRIAIISAIIIVALAAIGGIAYYLFSRNKITDEQLREQYRADQRSQLAPVVTEYFQSVAKNPPAPLTDTQKKQIVSLVKDQSRQALPALTEEQKNEIIQFMKDATLAEEQNYQTWKAEQLKKK